MIVFSITVLIAAFVKGDAVANGLCEILAKYSAEYPDHACAMFRKEPKTPHPYGLPSTWVWHHLDHWLLDYPYYVCISKSNHGDWVERTGHGGYDNWCYNPDPFTRTNDRRLTVI
ncbi:hypothetical protein DSO57_1006888 [Entomophthora muscae]|uniref:Uncharacterized protein n=1 Tax=Entomophthora muscae TaxID=34485 RepID=A0ACC2T7B4_9FUNG|nr:hypothetical protein DSO57_1006888 [Entomophthora muscae]